MVVHCGLRGLSHSWECLRWSGGDEWLMFVGGGGGLWQKENVGLFAEI